MKLIEDMTDWKKQQAIHSARYILSDYYEYAKESGINDLSASTGLPEGVIHEALENIFCAEIKF